MNEEQRLALTKVIRYVKEHYDSGDYTAETERHLAKHPDKELSAKDLLRLDFIERNLWEEREDWREFKRDAQETGEAHPLVRMVGQDHEMVAVYKREWAYLHDNPKEIEAYKTERDRIEGLIERTTNQGGRNISVEEFT